VNAGGALVSERDAFAAGDASWRKIKRSQTTSPYRLTKEIMINTRLLTTRQAETGEAAMMLASEFRSG
jgi:hypothetical protein